jgi:DNA adenine methylase
VAKAKTLEERSAAVERAVSRLNFVLRHAWAAGMIVQGGKWMLAPWIVGQLPPHEIYVEPYCGAASVFMRKPRARAEVLNDLDGDLVNVFRVLRDPQSAAKLAMLLELTPWARAEFEGSYRMDSTNEIERARKRIVRAFMAFGTTSERANTTGFRAKCYRQNQTGPVDWSRYPPAIRAFTERLKGVCLENRPALEVIHQQDGPDTLFYVDPPYPEVTRTAIDTPSRKDRAYAFDLTDEDHRQLADLLHDVQGMVVISSYPSELYDELYAGWQRRQRAHLADGALQRVEVLYLNQAARAHAQRSLEL